MPKKPDNQITLCHLADIHLGFRRYQRLHKSGFNQREWDVSASFRECVDSLIEINPDIVIIAGDLFHSVRPSNAVITFCFKQLRRLTENSKAEIVILAGNHESPKRSDSGSILKLFKEIERVHIADQQVESFRLANGLVNVTCLPHSYLSEHQEFQLTKARDCLYNVLALHAQVTEVGRSDFGGVQINLKNFSPHEWDYIALGHVHKYSQLGYNVCYSGAIEHTSNNIWFDACEKGFVELKLPTKDLKFHKLTSPRQIVDLGVINVLDFTPEDVLSLIEDTLAKVIGGLEGKIVKLDIQNISRVSLQNLDYKKIRQWKARALHLQLDFKLVNQLDSNATIERNEKTSLRAELEEFIKEKSDQLVDSERLHSKLKSYLDLVEIEHEAS